MLELSFGFHISYNSLHCKQCIWNLLRQSFIKICWNLLHCLLFCHLLQVSKLSILSKHCNLVTTPRCTLRRSFLPDSPFFKHFKYSCSWTFHKCGSFTDICCMIQISYNPPTLSLSNHIFSLSVLKESVLMSQKQSFPFLY